MSNTIFSSFNVGLEILYSLLRSVEKSENSAQNFYQTYYTMILQHIFSVVTDTSHTAGILVVRDFFERIKVKFCDIVTY